MIKTRVTSQLVTVSCACLTFLASNAFANLAPSFNLDYTAGPGGSLTGEAAQVVDYGMDGTEVTAVPEEGYHFVDWSDESTDSSRTDTNVTANLSVTANFEINSYSLSYDAGANGSISGATEQTVNYEADGTAVTAVPEEGYLFVGWSDESSDNPRTDTYVTADIAVTANFEINSYSLSYDAGANGSISGATSQTVNYGADGTSVTAVPDEGYHFVDWSDGSTDNPRTDTGVMTDISVTANFEINSYSLNYIAGANGSISGATSQTVNHGSDGTSVTAVPDIGYHFVDWSDGSTSATRTDTGVTADISVTANFEINSYSLTYSAGANGSISGATSQTANHGSDGTSVTAVPDIGYHFVDWSDGSTSATRTDTYVTADIAVTANFEINSYSLNYSAGANGSISGATSQTANHGSDGTSVTAVPDLGYHFVDWSDGSTSATRTDTGVTADISVTANFVINSYTLTCGAGANGSISPAGATTVTYGSDLVFTATAETGYQVDEWSLDGETVQTGGTDYTLSSIQADHTVEVTFSALWYTIDATAGPGGSIDSTSIDVQYGGSATFKATADTNYEVDTWSLDGSVVQTGGTTYDTGLTYADHTIHVTFVEVQVLSYSLGTFEFEDEEEFNRGIVNNNVEHPAEALVFIEPVGLGLDPDNVAMVLHNRKDNEGKTVNARAKGTFIKTGADEVLIYFNYLFMTSNVELVVYVSDSPLLMAPDDPLWEQHYIEAARLASPPFPRPGSVGSERFAVFQKIVWTGSLDFAQGLYVELELVEPDLNGILLASLAPRVPAGNGGSSVYVDNWSTGPAWRGPSVPMDIWIPMTWLRGTGP